MRLDLSFLDVPLKATSLPRPVNVYEILSDAWRESRVDMTLRFFLDPTERHGLGSLVMDALLTTLDDAPLIGRSGKSGTPFVAANVIGSHAWEISTQVEFIDVLAVNPELGLAVVIENKIGHEVNNPLDRYARHALRADGIASALVAVLAPEHRSVSAYQDNWLSRSITYAELSEEIKRAPRLVEHLLDPADLNQRRSLDLLQQFFEARSGGMNMSDLSAEATRITQWRELLDTHGEAIKEFLDARLQSWRLLTDRNKRLEPLVAERLDSAGLTVGWEAHGGNTHVETWNAYHFPDADWSVELKLSLNPDNPSIFVLDYAGRTYQNQTTEPLGVEWAASDDDVATAFAERVRHILERARNGHPATMAPGPADSEQTDYSH